MTLLKKRLRDTCNFMVCLKSTLLLIFYISIFTCNAGNWVKVTDKFSPLSPDAIHLSGYMENDIQNSIAHWNKGVVPYAAFVQFFITGKTKFALGEMWGKAVRSGCMFYRYTQDPELKKILRKTVYDILATQQSNGSISCVNVNLQPDNLGGDLWERKYVLLGLSEYYTNVSKDSAVLNSMIKQADCILGQVGPAPKVSILDLGWSATNIGFKPNHIESSTILEPIMRLYNYTGYQRYLDFAKYVADQGGTKECNIIEQAYNNVEPYKMGGSYPKGYEMMSFFEGLVEYYRITGNEYIKQAILNLYNNIRTKEITIIGNGGGDQPYHPKIMGEAWDNTALEQTNPNMKRMMETCVGVTWIKLCSQILRLTGDPSTVDEIEKYIYNGLIGAMKPSGDGFSYVNLLNGMKTNIQGWGAKIHGVDVTCCNLNGPMGLAYIPYVAVMNSATGPVINLYNAGTATATTSTDHDVKFEIMTDFPKSGAVVINITPEYSEKFIVKLRIPSWSKETNLKVNGKKQDVVPGTYKELDRNWSTGDKIEIVFDMRCRIIDAPKGSNSAGDNYQALVMGPIVLARDENIDPDFDKPVTIVSKKGYVEIIPEKPTLELTRIQVQVPTDKGYIHMVDYSSVDSWDGKRVCTWLPKEK